jgi:hypothetical protein
MDGPYNIKDKLHKNFFGMGIMCIEAACGIIYTALVFAVLKILGLLPDFISSTLCMIHLATLSRANSENNGCNLYLIKSARDGNIFTCYVGSSIYINLQHRRQREESMLLQILNKNIL